MLMSTIEQEVEVWTTTGETYTGWIEYTFAKDGGAPIALEVGPKGSDRKVWIPWHQVASIKTPHPF